MLMYYFSNLGFDSQKGSFVFLRKCKALNLSDTRKSPN